MTENVLEYKFNKTCEWAFTYRVEFNLDKTEFYRSLIFNYIDP